MNTEEIRKERGLKRIVHMDSVQLAMIYTTFDAVLEIYNSPNPRSIAKDRQRPWHTLRDQHGVGCD